ncbi:MAG: hypothetical protein N3A68_05825 [Bacteroidia bacterium]|jgi:hypothetical protein|nr:hypothetical protein [Bacteroidia bacterium]GIV24035.1 MAG: hypothetical protein KatS3mg025_1694 [Bacteroidia bacterium]
MRWIGLVASCALYSQPLDAPKPFYWGGSLGIGGNHLWFRPALTVRYNHTFFYCSPFPAYLSLGVAHPVAFFMQKERYDRPIYAALHLHQRYWSGKELRGDTRVVLLMGVRVWLEPYLQRFYLQAGIGTQVHRVTPEIWRLLPSGEVELGGFYRPHKYVPKRLRREGIEQW